MKAFNVIGAVGRVPVGIVVEMIGIKIGVRCGARSAEKDRMRGVVHIILINLIVVIAVRA